MSEGSHYKQIDGKKYSKALLAAADEMVAGKGDGRISIGDAEKLFGMLSNDYKYTELEKATISYIRQNYKFTTEGDAFLRGAVASWAGEKAAKTRAANAKSAE